MKFKKNIFINVDVWIFKPYYFNVFDVWLNIFILGTKLENFKEKVNTFNFNNDFSLEW